jgi:hypothetical protein
LEYAASEVAVSPFVEMVGAVDFALVAGTWLSYPEQAMDGSLYEHDRGPLTAFVSETEETKSLLYSPTTFVVPERG